MFKPQLTMVNITLSCFLCVRSNAYHLWLSFPACGLPGGKKVI